MKFLINVYCVLSFNNKNIIKKKGKANKQKYLNMNYQFIH